MLSERISPVDLEELKNGMSANLQTRDFLITCIKDGVLEHELLGEEKPKKWERNLDITFTYFLTPMTLQQIGEKHGITHRAMGKIVRGTLDKLWNNAPEPIRNKFPKELLSSCKDLVLSRVISPYESKKDKVVDFAYQKRQNVKKRLTKYDPVRFPVQKSVQDKLEEANNDHEVQSLLNSMSEYMLKKYSRVNNSSITNISKVIGSCQGRSGVDSFIQTLKEENIPFRIIEKTVHPTRRKVRILRYCYIAVQDRERARRSFIERELIEDNLS